MTTHLSEKELWDELDEITKNESLQSQSQVNSIEESFPSPIVCSHCGSDQLDVLNDFKITCFSCGVTSTFATDDASFNTVSAKSGEFGVQEISQRYCKKTTKELCKLQKRLAWSHYTNEEKNEYKLKLYIDELCERIGISEGLVVQIKNTVVQVMNIIKSTDGTKRARVKDGIILVCIEYVGKRNNVTLSATKLGKSIGIDIKYITRAESILLELLHTKKLTLDKDILLSTRTPYDYVEDIVRKQRLSIPCSVLDTVKHVIDICERHELLLDHTPLSIGVCSFYYVLTELVEPAEDIDIHEFSQMYDLSIVTVTKTTAKLKQHGKFIRELLGE